MGNKKFKIHPQLAEDSHELFAWQSSYLRLHKNATLPWLIIIPISEQIEFHDLPADLQIEVTLISQVASNHFKQQLGVEKINFAAIGNVVQQLHIHVIGRHKNDPLWPNVIWGNKLPDAVYTQHQIEKLKFSLYQALESAP